MAIRLLFAIIGFGCGLVGGHMLNVNWLVSIVSLGVGFVFGITAVVVCAESNIPLKSSGDGG